MNLASTIAIYGGGPGSGCRGDDCGRKSTGLTKKTPLEEKKIADDFKAEVARQGYDSSKVEIVPKGTGFNYDENFGQALASTNAKTGVIQLSPAVWTDENMKGIVAHELMHLRMHGFIDDHREEFQNLRTSGKLKKMALADGVTPYSWAVWGNVAEGKQPIPSGFQETLAEMARVEAEGGKLDWMYEGKEGVEMWAKLYDRVKSYGFTKYQN